MGSDPTVFFSRNRPESPDDELFGAPYGELRPRRSTAVRALIASAVVLPVCFAGWFGWRATADHSHEHRPAAAPPASAAGPAAGSSSPAGTRAASPAAGSPSPSRRAVTAGRPLAGRTVVLDPGHNPTNNAHTAAISRQVDVGNGHKECDTTGTETDAGYPEASFTLDVVRRARKILEARGARVILTQDGDRSWGPCVDERAGIGNRAHADAALSVHGDGGPAAGHGFHVILPARVVAGKADTSSITGSSRALGLLLRKDFAATTGEPYSTYLGKDGLDVRSDLGGLNLSRVPKVFIECGNMRNATDARRMTDPAWRQRAAQGIAEALTSFVAGTSR